MSFSDVILVSKITRGVIAVTAILVLLLATWIFGSALGSPPESQLIFGGGRSNLSSQSRMPQSIAPILIDSREGSSLPDLKVETVDLGCLSNTAQSLEFKSNAKQVRIKGRLCNGRSISIDDSSVQNRANGYLATLFKLPKNTFTSDFISLNSGTNQILFQIVDEKGNQMTANLQILTEIN